MATRVILPTGIVASLFDSELQNRSPKIHLNQVDQRLLNQNVRGSIYLSGDNWIEINSERFQIDDFPAFDRPRRSHYLNDFNSVRWSILPSIDGITLRVEFETEGNEIKGYCRRCLVGNRDRRAADANILAPEGSEFPFIEVDIRDSIISGGNVQILRPEEGDVRVGMGIDGNGFLEIFESLIGRRVRSAFKDAIFNNWGIISARLSDTISEGLNQNIEGLGKLKIFDLSFSGNQSSILLGLDTEIPIIDRVFSHFTHTLEDGVKQLILIGSDAIDGVGNAIDNIIKGNDAANFLRGLAGNDNLLGGGGDDILSGGDGSDTLTGDEGDDIIWGDSYLNVMNARALAAPGVEGNDVIDGGSGNDEIHGGAGADIIYGGMDDDTIYGDQGNDHLYGGSGNDAIAGGVGIDTVHYENSPGNVVIDLMRGRAVDGFGTVDTISEVENIIGSQLGDDTLMGDGNDNSISGSGGNDHLMGHEGNDFLDGGSGNDILDGGAGIDTASFSDTTRGLYINFETGEVRGNAGNDQLISIENVSGTAFDDVIIGDATENALHGLGGNDVIAGGMGRDTIYGGDGDDVLRGDRNAITGGIASGDADIIYGGNGNDQIGGKAGHDQLFGDAGDDQLWGDRGDDLLRGGLGNDELRGGKGKDTYVLALGEGTDIFDKFRFGEDCLGLVGGLTVDQLAFEKISGGTMVYAGDESLAFVRYAKPSDFTANSSGLFVQVS